MNGPHFSSARLRKVDNTSTMLTHFCVVGASSLFFRIEAADVQSPGSPVRLDVAGPYLHGPTAGALVEVWADESTPGVQALAILHILISRMFRRPSPSLWST
jgi:hypothetical protein